MSRTASGLNFAIFSSSAKKVRLVLFNAGAQTEVPLDLRLNRTGHIWHVEIADIDMPLEYGWRMDGPAGDDLLIDPYARAVSAEWKNGKAFRRRSLAVSRPFDWQGVGFPRVPKRDRIIYEIHVKGFAGSYLGMIDKIPYLKQLGITSIELLPVFEFDEASINEGLDPAMVPKLSNFWGYNPINFFSPHGGFASGANGEQIDEFKTMVRELHRAGIEVFLDVVFNHTAEGGGHVRKVNWSLRGIDERAYYMLDKSGKYLDFSGCGNTLNCNHPAVRELIRDSLVYWVSEMHVDGFRFDLASVLTRGLDGMEMPSAPLIDELSRDPLLVDTALIAEAWDAAGLYHVGRFQGGTRWAEWNGLFRDDVRHFVRGDEGFTGKLATRLAGSSDLYEASARSPLHSINFVTCHDGFTLRDLISYERKHNEANGEQGRDGSNDNISANYGAEGPTDDANVLELRRRQTLNFLTVLLLAQGTPMLLGGDEAGRTQRGNNNAYCQDNEISWFDWSLVEKNADLVDFTSKLIAFRRRHPALRRDRFLTGGDVTWHGVRPNAPDFSQGSRTLAMQLGGNGAGDVYFAINAWREPVEFLLPDGDWRFVLDTSRATKRAFDGGTARGELVLAAHSCVLLTR